MMTDPIDERLRATAARWRVAHPPTSVEVPALPTLTGRRGWWVAVAAAAAVAAIALVVASMLGGADRTTPPPAGGHPGVVPWKPLPPTHPTLPVRTVSPRPRLGLTDPCDPGDLAISAPSFGAAMGTVYANFVLTAVHGACRIEGRPRIVPYDHDRPLDQVRVRSMADLSGVPARAVVVAPRRPGGFTVAWAASHDCRRIDNTRLEILLPYLAYRTGDLVRQPVYRRGFGRTTCNPGEGARPMLVAPVATRTRARVVSLYAGVDATISGPHRATLGSSYDFRVTLHVRHTVVLDPCPDYDIGGNAGDFVFATRTYALNCAAVPTRSPDGRPELRPDTPVTFAMRARLPEGRVGLVWQLTNGDAQTGTNVTVRPHD
jgi:hypothetical protein